MITLTIEQAQQIEEALVATTLNKDYWLEKCMDSLDTIRAARAREQAEQEPVAIEELAWEACAPNQTFNSDEEWIKHFVALLVNAPQPSEQGVRNELHT